MPSESKKCGCGFGHKKSAFGKSADSFFNNLNGQYINNCVASGYGKPIFRFGNIPKKNVGPMSIGSKKNKL